MKSKDLVGEPTERPRRTMRAKLVALVLVSVGVAVALVAGVSAWRDGTRDAALQAERLRATASAIGSVAADAAASGDRARAFEALRAVAHMPGVDYGRIERLDGTLLTETGAGARLLGDVQVGAPSAAGGKPSLLANLSTRSFEVTAPISAAGRPVGRIVLMARSEGVLDRFLSSLAASGLAAAAAVAVGLAVAWRLQQGLTRPITALTRSMDQVERDHDYARSVDVQSDDEVGALVRGFNRMLGEIRARDARIAEHMAGLERQVADRTADLRVAKEAAEAANGAKSDFLATMSHEIRTPMNGIMVMAEMLAAGEMPPRQRRFAEVIAKSGSSLLAIINDILDFSKIEAGKLELESLPVDLCEVVEDVASLFWEKASSKQLDLATFVDPATPRLILGDPTRLRQVVGNLVNNAIKFTETGGVLIEVEPDGATSVRISVRDTGIGIPKNKIPTVFGAFSQADQSTTRKFGGTGLGLSICKRLVDAMGGRFHVTSELGRGSTFAFRLPAVVEEAAGDWAQARSAEARTLIAHGGLSTRRALGRYLARAGYTVIDGRTAEGDLDLIVADPSAVREMAPHLAPVVCLAGYGDSAPGQLQREGLVQAVLIQPFRRRDIGLLLGQIERGETLTDVGADAEAAAVDALPAFSGARVLVADDSAVNREVAMEALARLGIEPQLVNDGRAAVEAAEREAWDLILMDGSMPEMDGYEATRAIRAREQDGGPRTPIVALTAHVVGSAAESWRDAGMDAVLHKPFTLASLAKTLGQFLRPGEPVAAAPAPPAPVAAPVVKAVAAPPASELIDADVAAQLAAMAGAGKGDFVDRVRGLYRDNAPAALAQLVEAVRAHDAPAAARAAHSLKSMSFNMGAKAVAALAGTLETEARDGAVPALALVARLGDTLDRTLKALGGEASSPKAPAPAPQTLAAQPSPAPPQAVAADEAPEPAPPPASDEDQGLLTDLTAAVAAGQFSLVYQPQFDRDGDQVVGVEALIRWLHPDRGLVSPARFIPLAEVHGVISPVTDWVIDQIIADAPLLEGVTVAFNVSAREFQQADFVGRIHDRFKAAKLDPHGFEIEITETALLDRERQVLDNVRLLRGLGYRIALDDFGVGYTSLRHLRRIPFDKLKIDREFVTDCISDVQSASLVHAVVSVGRALGMKVVAEGVETEMQRRFLKVAGVHAMQGYLFAKPMSVRAVAELRAARADPQRQIA